MAFLPGIFGRAASTPQAQPSPVNTNGSGGPAAQQAQPANSQVAPEAQAAQTAPIPPAGGPQNPLDTFTNYFKPQARDPKAPVAPTLRDPLLAPLDPAKFKEQVAQANFTQGISPELMQKAISGDVAAFSEAINSAAREAFSAAAQLSHGLAENATRTGLERMDGMIDGRIKNYNVRTQGVSNSALGHPAVAPMVQAMKVQIAQANPSLSPMEIQQQAEQYFEQVSTVLQSSKQAANPPAPTGPKETNFASYL